MADTIVNALKIPLVLYLSNHYGSEGVTIMKDSVIIYCVSWKLTCLVIFADLDIRMFLDTFHSNVKDLWYKNNACSDIITEGRKK